MNKTKKLVFAGVIAALYTAISLFLLPFTYGSLQFRAAESLTVLPYLFPNATFGLFIGCVITNMFSPFGIIDVIFGGTASLISALLTYRIGKYFKQSAKGMFLAPVPPIIINAVVIGWEISFLSSEGFTMASFLLFGGQIFLSQLVICYGLGIPLLFIMRRFADKIN